MRKAALLETLLWTDLEGPLSVEHSRHAMEEIRRRAEAALIALPRFGMGIGGALIGERRGVTLRLLHTIELPCSHSSGPSFRLTPEERVLGKALLPYSGVIGWYCSKPRGPLELSAIDCDLFDELFPGAWKIVLVVQPSLSETMNAAIFFRDGAGNIVPAGQQVIEKWAGPKPAKAPLGVPGLAPPFDLAEPPLVEPERAAPEVAEPELVEPEVVEPLLFESEVAERVPDPPAASAVAEPPATAVAETVNAPDPLPPPIPEVAPAAMPHPISATVPLASYVRKPAPERHRRSRLGWILAAVLLVLIAAAGWLGRDYWWPRPPLAVTFVPNGTSLEIRWDPKALRAVEHASMFVSDGGELKEIRLDARQIAAGRLLYGPQSDRVTATLDAGELRASAQYVMPNTGAK